VYELYELFSILLPPLPAGTYTPSIYTTIPLYLYATSVGIYSYNSYTNKTKDLDSYKDAYKTHTFSETHTRPFQPLDTRTHPLPSPTTEKLQDAPEALKPGRLKTSPPFFLRCQ
jgi:hypothetical protein